MNVKRDQAEIRKAKVLLAVVFVIGLAYDIWAIASGNVNLGKHVPGFPELIAGLWYYAVCRLEKIPPQLWPKG